MALQFKKSSFAFTDTLETIVMVSISENERVPAELIIEQGKLSKLKFDYLEDSKVLSICDVISKNNKVECSNTQMSFQLTEFYSEDFKLDSMSRKLSIPSRSQPILHPEYVLLGSPETKKFDGFEVLFSSFSEWFSDSLGYKQDKEKNLTYKISQRSFEVEVTTNNNRKIKISSETNYQTKSNGRISSIEEYSPISVEVLDGGTLAVNDIRKMVFEVRQLLQLLLGFPINVEHVWCRSEEKGYPLYYTNFESTTNTIEHFRETFIHPVMLEEDNNWEMIFRNYYSNYDIFNCVWFNMIGLANFKGLWTLELLGYFGIFDARVTKYCGSRMSKDHFKIRYKKVKDKILKDIQNILGFTDEEYKNLYKLRNEIAHGTPPVKADITYERQLQDKLFLTLSFWIYNDLGFSPQFFLKCINNSNHKALRNAKINRTELDRATGTPFFKVNKEDYEAITTAKYSVLEKYGDLYILNHEFTDLAREAEIELDIEDGINKSLEKKGKRIKMINSAYLTQNKPKKEKMVVHAICIIQPLTL